MVGYSPWAGARYISARGVGSIPTAPRIRTSLGIDMELAAEGTTDAADIAIAVVAAKRPFPLGAAGIFGNDR